MDDNRTYINPSIGASTEINDSLVSGTVINGSLDQTPGPGFTEVNPAVSGEFHQLPAGSLLCGKYRITELLHQTSGEAILYICEYQGKKYVAKIYRRIGAVKDEVITALTGITSPYIAKLYETGSINGMPFEILPYYKYGSLEGKTFDTDTLESVIIPELNEGLRELHSNGIIHKDLKPANIMLCDNQKDVAIIDFGISSVRSGGNTVVMTKTGMTPEYSASETFRNLFLEESDYYSLGITIYELYVGRTPYEGMAKEEIEKYVAIQKIPFPYGFPERLKKLITGLTYNDITNRKDKSNPNRRWTYDEVNNWLRGVEQTLPGGSFTEESEEQLSRPYNFYRRRYYNLNELMTAMALRWDTGKKHVFRSTMSDFFRTENPDIANICMDAEEEVRRDKTRTDIAFFKTIYRIAPSIDTVYWKGSDFGSIGELGTALQSVEEGSLSEEIREMISYHAFSELLSAKDFNRDIILGMEAAEQKYIDAATRRDRNIALNILGRFLTGNTRYSFNGVSVGSIDELAQYLLGLKGSSMNKYKEAVGKLLKDDKVLNPGFEAWLLILGKSSAIDTWRKV